jgi:hypothetical protein
MRKKHHLQPSDQRPKTRPLPTDPRSKKHGARKASEAQAPAAKQTDLRKTPLPTVPPRACVRKASRRDRAAKQVLVTDNEMEERVYYWRAPPRVHFVECDPSTDDDAPKMRSCAKLRLKERKPRLRRAQAIEAGVFETFLHRRNDERYQVCYHVPSGKRVSMKEMIAIASGKLADPERDPPYPPARSSARYNPPAVAASCGPWRA